MAAALVLQTLFVLCPEARGDLSDVARQEVREAWYPKMFARSKTAGNRERHLPFLERARRGELPPGLTDLRRAGPAGEGGGKVAGTQPVRRGRAHTAPNVFPAHQSLDEQPQGSGRKNTADGHCRLTRFDNALPGRQVSV